MKLVKLDLAHGGEFYVNPAWVSGISPADHYPLSPDGKPVEPIKGSQIHLAGANTWQTVIGSPPTIAAMLREPTA